jgi:hypothetical protein
MLQSCDFQAGASWGNFVGVSGALEDDVCFQQFCLPADSWVLRADFLSGRNVQEMD